MPGLGTSLDHVGIVARDPATTAALYERLGFQLTPLARQQGPLGEGSDSVPWGSANRCAMLRCGYLELIGIVDPALYDNGLGAFLARYEGMHILAFATDDAGAALARLRAGGLAVPGVKPMQRPAGGGIARFRRVPLAAAPEGRVQLIQHETPELLWLEPLLDHPNGAIALTETLLCVADPPEAAARFARLTGVAARQADGTAILDLPQGGRLTLCTPPVLPRFLPGLTPPALPWFAGFTVATADGNDAARRLLDQRDIPYSIDGKRLVVPPTVAGGTACIFAPG